MPKPVEVLLTKNSISFSVRRIMMLEFSQYLENYLWPYYEAGKASNAHMMSIIVMINEKFRERVPAWQVCTSLLSMRTILLERFKLSIF